MPVAPTSPPFKKNSKGNETGLKVLQKIYDKKSKYENILCVRKTES
jgi:hypothetical protein